MELIGNIFFHNSPLHDGAMILRDGKLYAAGCFLPLSDNYDISKQLGTRHRAALGMSENSDALVIVVSEEKGVISVALEGKLTRGYDAEMLRELLEKTLLPEKNISYSKSFIYNNNVSINIYCNCKCQPYKHATRVRFYWFIYK